MIQSPKNSVILVLILVASIFVPMVTIPMAPVSAQTNISTSTVTPVYSQPHNATITSVTVINSSWFVTYELNWAFSSSVLTNSTHLSPIEWNALYYNGGNRDIFNNFCPGQGYYCSYVDNSSTSEGIQIPHDIQMSYGAVDIHPAGNLSVGVWGMVVVGPATVDIPWQNGVQPNTPCYIHSFFEDQILQFNGTTVNPNVIVKESHLPWPCYESATNVWQPPSVLVTPPGVTLTILPSTPSNTVLNFDWIQNSTNYGDVLNFTVGELEEQLNGGSNVFQIVNGSTLSVVFPEMVRGLPIQSPQNLNVTVTQNTTIGASYGESFSSGGGIPWIFIADLALLVVGVALRAYGEHQKHMYMINFFRHTDETPRTEFVAPVPLERVTEGGQK